MNERQHFYIGVKGIIKNDKNEALLLRDASRNKWELPGGRIDQGESIENAFAREISEELSGAKLTQLDHLIYAGLGDFLVENDFKLLLLYYAVEVVMPPNLVLSTEHTEAQWASKEKVDKLDLFKADRIAVSSSF